MNYSNIVIVVALLVSISAESTENKNEWNPNVNKEINSENNQRHSNVYLPPIEQHISPPAQYPNYNIPSVANAPQQQYYYPVNTFTQGVAPKPAHSYNHQPNFIQSYPVHTYNQEPNYVGSVPVPSPTYLPLAPQYSQYSQSFIPQMNQQVVPKPETLLSIPYNIGMEGIGFMAKVLTNAHQGIGSFTGYLQPPPPQVGHGFIPEYEAQKNIPLQYGYGNRNIQVEATPYSHGVYGGYITNMEKNYDNLYYPRKGSNYRYNNLNSNEYSAWNAPNYADNRGKYYYVQ